MHSLIVNQIVDLTSTVYLEKKTKILFVMSSIKLGQNLVHSFLNIVLRNHVNVYHLT